MTPPDTAHPSDIAIAHDYLTQRGGAEKVVLALQRAFPEAPIYTTLFEPQDTYPEFAESDVITSPLNHISALRRSHRLALPFLAWAASRIHVKARHTIVSTSGWAHGFRTSGSKIVYCYSPARWLYQPNAYLGGTRLTAKRVLLSLISPILKRWDQHQATTATKYFAISTAVRGRIRDAYGIDAEVLPAPHSVDTSLEQESVPITGPAADGPFYLCISRLLPYKNVDVVVRAFNNLGLPLVVVGTGPEEKRLAALAGTNVTMVKNLTDGQMRWLYARCTAVAAASYEDFGLTPIEAAAYGKPSVVLRWGGFLDTIREEVTGIYFDHPDPALVADAVRRSQGITWDSDKIIAHSQTFSEEHFVTRLRAEIERIDANDAA